MSLGKDEAPSGKPLLGMTDLWSWKEALGKPSTIAKWEVSLSHFIHPGTAGQQSWIRLVPRIMQ